MAISEVASPLLGDGGRSDYVDDTVDFRGCPAIRSKSGGWKSSLFIIGVEVSERFAYYGIASNLISYLTGPLHQSNAVAAANVNVWQGVSAMLPLLGAFVADAYLGRYRTILISSMLYILGLTCLTISTILPPGSNGHSGRSAWLPLPEFQVAFFFFSLYLAAIGAGGHKPCTQAFGADQFDESSPLEQMPKNSFFNWWYFGLCSGSLVSMVTVNYIQEYLGWGYGYGITCLSMGLSLAVFLIGTFTYRFKLSQEGSPFTSIVQVLVAAVRRSQWPIEESEHDRGATRQFRAALPLNPNCSFPSKRNNWTVCSVEQVEEVKGVLRLFPIWASCLMYAVFFSQSSTFFTKQGSTMDRKISSSFLVPPASLQCFIGISVVLFIPIYDQVLVPIARSFTGVPSGITLLQRIGTGLFFSILSMVVAALVELKRVNVAKDSGLIDFPAVTLPISIWWLLPQYILFGVSEAFTMVGLQEFFYDQMPNTLRSMGIALYLSIFGVGSFLSGFLISLIEKLSSATSGGSWFSTNLNKAHLDYFYWLLAGLSILGLCVYVFFAQSYIYRNKYPSSKDGY
ncbi:NRT1-PTR FAMILY 5-10 protein [Nymphaea thermarum]|nr:NRT1-PTR FAMILY 5-10 protein [Nymphaea thermarum]